ncbi:hypothetical protein [Paraburkholderia sp. A1RO-5L]|uniref:hypothetical protein n=1 Tax=Paraburkholderia sp. A1RO-5L TaxID=3028370 RepID=UPI003B81BE41
MDAGQCVEQRRDATTNTNVSNLAGDVTNLAGNVTTINGQITNMQGQLADAVMYDSSSHSSVTLGGKVQLRRSR